MDFTTEWMHIFSMLFVHLHEDILYAEIQLKVFILDEYILKQTLKLCRKYYARPPTLKRTQF